MSKTKDVQEQVEAILQEQISLLRIRAKECSRQFNHQRYDELTAEYNVLENKLKALIAHAPKTEIETDLASRPEIYHDDQEPHEDFKLIELSPSSEIIQVLPPPSPLNWGRSRQRS